MPGSTTNYSWAKPLGADLANTLDNTLAATLDSIDSVLHSTQRPTSIRSTGGITIFFGYGNPNLVQAANAKGDLYIRMVDGLDAISVTSQYDRLYWCYVTDQTPSGTGWIEALPKRTPYKLGPWYVEGTVSIADLAAKEYIADTDYTCYRWAINATTAPTGHSLIVDVKYNGSSIFANDAARPTITAGNHTGSSTTIASPGLGMGGLVSVGVTAVGTTVAGADLTIQGYAYPA